METGSITIKLKTEKSSKSWVVSTWEEAAKKADQFKKYRRQLSFNIELIDDETTTHVKLTELQYFMYGNDRDLGSIPQTREALKTLKKRVRELEAMLELSPDQYKNLIEGFDRARFGEED